MTLIPQITSRHHKNAGFLGEITTRQAPHPLLYLAQELSLCAKAGSEPRGHTKALWLLGRNWKDIISQIALPHPLYEWRIDPERSLTRIIPTTTRSAAIPMRESSAVSMSSVEPVEKCRREAATGALADGLLETGNKGELGVGWSRDQAGWGEGTGDQMMEGEGAREVQPYLHVSGMELDRSKALAPQQPCRGG